MEFPYGQLLPSLEDMHYSKGLLFSCRQQSKNKVLVIALRVLGVDC
jgi:hypothetical protein